MADLQAATTSGTLPEIQLSIGAARNREDVSIFKDCLLMKDASTDGLPDDKRQGTDVDFSGGEAACTEAPDKEIDKGGDIQAARQVKLKQPRTSTAMKEKRVRKVLQPRNDAALRHEAEWFRLRSLAMCMLCCSNYRNVVFLPCAHRIYCFGCVRMLHECPLCMEIIQEKIRIAY